MMWFTGSLVLLLVEVCVSQVHLGPVGDLQEVECYTCENHGHNVFPECLKHTHVCHLDEVCKVVYGQGLPEMRCQKAVDCARETSNPMRNCTGGGVEVSLNKCELCCDTTACVSDIVQLIKDDIGSSDNLMCPGECPANDLQRCVDHSKMCGLNQFCQVTQEHGTVWGECKDNHELHHCNEEINHHACDGNTDPHGHHGHGKCYWDCCATNNCLSAHFGAYMSTAAPTTPTAAATTPVPTVQGETLWERLKGDCKDQLAGDQCKQLVGTQDVCHDRLALSICPESCGLCDAFNGSVCADTVLNDGCQNLLIHEDVCSDKLAVFICPQTCNMCTELINSIVTSLLGPGESNSTDVPPSLLPPSADPSSYPTFDCEDLNEVGCGILDSLCSTSLVNVVCPDKCKLCTDPIQTATVNFNMTTTAAPASTTAMPAAPTTAMPAATTTDMMMNITMPPSTAAPATGAPAGSTTMMMTNGPTDTTAPLCADHLTGMNCSQLNDVCASVMALSVCPKYCGLCSSP